MNKPNGVNSTPKKVSQNRANFSCVGKVQYKSLRFAKLKARVKKNEGMHAYFCKNCHFYHIGH